MNITTAKIGRASQRLVTTLINLIGSGQLSSFLSFCNTLSDDRGNVDVTLVGDDSSLYRRRNFLLSCLDIS